MKSEEKDNFEYLFLISDILKILYIYFYKKEMSRLNKRVYFPRINSAGMYISTREIIHSLHVIIIFSPHNIISNNNILVITYIS